MSDSDPSSFVAWGQRVHVSVATAADIDPYRAAMERSAARIGRWNPVNPDDLVHHLAAQGDKHRTILVRANDSHRADDAGLVGCVNITNVVHGRFMSGTLGYNAFDPYVGGGLFREGLALVVGIALRPNPSGMGLHRVEANVRVGNLGSAGVLRSLGFRRERTIRRMLWLADGLDGASAWRDHDSYAATREEWPPPQYAPNDQPTGVLVCGPEVDPRHLDAVARELAGVALVGLLFDTALEIAVRAGAPVLWHAGDRAVDALRLLGERGRRSFAVTDELVDLDGTPRQIIDAALRLRPLLG